MDYSNRPGKPGQDRHGTAVDSRGIPPGMSIDDYMRMLHGKSTRTGSRMQRSTLHFIGMMVLAVFGWLALRYMSSMNYMDHLDPAARAKMQVVDIEYEDLLEARVNQQSFRRLFGGKLFRLTGVATSVMEQQQTHAGGSNEILGPAVLMTPDTRRESYLATFYKEEQAKMDPVMPGAQVTIVCDHLEVVKGKRLEGCTLERYRNAAGETPEITMSGSLKNST
ncbi:hypothetical protein [Xanthomonas arboricola]|uniref:hypothetical protein n=1 Tax=Xanthomonas arboricola TaxID=56448 RepID=UPI000CEDB41D|nr:hypothetical protein [Xanthomonas arboricola]PPU18468.1 hypothetical protein XarbCFBP7610_16385 [Xanthomonas arboricola]